MLILSWKIFVAVHKEILLFALKKQHIFDNLKEKNPFLKDKGLRSGENRDRDGLKNCSF